LTEMDVNVILNEIKHLNNKFDEFKAEVKSNIDELKRNSEGRCTDCINTALLKQRQNMMWANVVALWMVFGTISVGLLGAFLTHTLGGGK
jgi:hypothetical protein